MSCASWLLPLMQVEVATRETVRELREGFGGGAGPSNPYALAYVLGAIAFVLLVLAVARRLLGGMQAGNQTRDELSLASRALDLNSDQCQDIARLAAAARIASPVSMLLSPGVYATALAATEFGLYEPELMERLERIGRNLFEVDELPQVCPEESRTQAT